MFSLVNAISNEALKDANIDTKDMIIDRDRFGINLANLNGFLWHIVNLKESESKRERFKGYTFTLASVLAMQHKIYGPHEVF